MRPIFFLFRPFLPGPKDEFFLELAVQSRADFLATFDTRNFAGAHRFAVRAISSRRAVPPDRGLAARQQASVERIVSAALAEKLSGWTRVEEMAQRSSRDRFLAALDKIPTTEPEDRL